MLIVVLWQSAYVENILEQSVSLTAFKVRLYTFIDLLRGTCKCHISTGLLSIAVQMI